MEKPQRIRWMEYTIITGVFLGILYFIFTKDINPIRKPKQIEEIKTQNPPLQIDTMPKINELSPELKKIAQYLTENLGYLEKDRLTELIPELPALKQQFEETLRSWETHPTPTPQ